MRGANRLLIIFAAIIAVVILILVFILLRGNNQGAADPAQVGVAPGNIQTAPPVAGTTAPGGNTGAAAAAPTVANNVTIIVAARALPAGYQLKADDLDTINKPRTDVNDEDILQKEFAVNRITKIAYNPNQQIRKSELVEGSFSNYMRQLVADRRLEPGKKAFAYATNYLSSVAGLIQENDLIDVVATFAVDRRPVNVTIGGQQYTVPIPGFEVTTKTILQNVRVLKVVKFGPSLEPVSIPRPTTPPPGETPTGVPAAAVAGTATPLPTLPPFRETGEGAEINTVLVLALTDQEAEILKFTRESRLTGGVASVPALTNPAASAAQPGTTPGSSAAGASNPNQPQLVGGTTSSANFSALTNVPIIHFLLRARPQDTSNPQDPAIAFDRTSGATFRVLVRDYGLPIPEIVYATNAQ